MHVAMDVQQVSQCTHSGACVAVVAAKQSPSDSLLVQLVEVRF